MNRRPRIFLGASGPPGFYIAILWLMLSLLGTNPLWGLGLEVGLGGHYDSNVRNNFSYPEFPDFVTTEDSSLDLEIEGSKFFYHPKATFGGNFYLLHENYLHQKDANLLHLIGRIHLDCEILDSQNIIYTFQGMSKMYLLKKVLPYEHIHLRAENGIKLNFDDGQFLFTVGYGEFRPLAQGIFYTKEMLSKIGGEYSFLSLYNLAAYLNIEHKFYPNYSLQKNRKDTLLTGSFSFQLLSNPGIDFEYRTAYNHNQERSLRYQQNTLFLNLLYDYGLYSISSQLRLHLGERHLSMAELDFKEGMARFDLWSISLGREINDFFKLELFFEYSGRFGATNEELILEFNKFQGGIWIRFSEEDIPDISGK